MVGPSSCGRVDGVGGCLLLYQPCCSFISATRDERVCWLSKASGGGGWLDKWLLLDKLISGIVGGGWWWSRINNNNNISSDQGEIWTSDNNNKGMLRIESSQRPTDPRNLKKLNAGNGEGEEASHKSTNKSFPSDQVSQRDTDKAPSLYYRTGARGDDQWAGLGRL